MGWVTSDHAESLQPKKSVLQNSGPEHLLPATYRRKGCHLGLSIVGGDVVDRHASLTCQPEIHILWHPLERPVRSSEVQRRGPVVGKVLGKRAACAGRLCGRVELPRGHGRVKRVAADDLVK